jgi:hypothetical protein
MGHSHRGANGQALYGFPGPDDQKSYTCTHVLEDGQPILRVSHDVDDGAWQFLCDGLHEDAAVGRVVCLGCMVERDPSLQALADLPPGWGADRATPSAPWERSVNDYDDAADD